MKRLKVKGKDYYVRKTDVALMLEKHICNASLFDSVEVDFLCQMFDYEVVKETKKNKYVINYNELYLNVESIPDVSFCFELEQKVEDALWFETEEGAENLLQKLKLIFPVLKNAYVEQI